MDIRIIEGDLLKADVDVIVNAANTHLEHVGGIAAAIARAAGAALVLESNRLGLIPTGSAVATTAGELPFKAVVHAVGPVWGGGIYEEATLLELAYRSAVECAGGIAAAYGQEWKIGFPAISCGVFGYPVERAAPVAIRALDRAAVKGISSAAIYVMEEAHAKAFARALSAFTGKPVAAARR